MKKFILSKLPAPIVRALGFFKTENKEIEALYQEKDYIEAYRAHTDIRVSEDKQDAIGGMWDAIGQLQFDFMRAQGLTPEHRFFDFGCGTLRGGIHYIKYLNAGNYTGLDISSAVIDEAKAIVAEQGLNDKNPELLLNEDLGSMFGMVDGRTFDYTMAQSVLTHLPEDLVEQFFASVGVCMDANSKVYFTFWERGSMTRLGVKDFAYPFAHFEALGRKYGFDVTNLSGQYDHPRGQQMALIQKSA